MVRSYSRWFIGFLVVIVIFVMGACARHSPREANPIPPARDTRSPDLSSALYDERKIVFAHHALYQLNHVVNSLNFAMSHRLDERMVISNETDSLVYGCRLINKLSPAFERNFDASVEELRVLYVKCEPEDLNLTHLTSASMNGQSLYTVVYDKLYPRLGAPELTLGYPVYIGQRTGPVNILLNHEAGHKTKLARITRISANRVENTDTEAVYRLSAEITDLYSHDRAGEGSKNGRIQVEIGDVMVRVLKASRKVISLKVGSFSIKARPEGIHLGSVNSSLTSPLDETIEVVLGVPETLTAVDLPCRPLAGRFHIYVGGNVMGALVVNDAKIAFEAKEAEDFRLCEREDDVIFLDAFEQIFN